MNLTMVRNTGNQQFNNQTTETMKDKQLQDIIDDVKDLTDLMDWN